MKRYLLVSLFFISCIYINAGWYSNRNYQGIDANSYLGKEIVVMPLDKNPKLNMVYRNFKVSYFDINESTNNVTLIYKYNLKANSGQYGTPYPYLEGRQFTVINVELMADCKSLWLFTLEDESNGEIIKYVYDGSLNFVNTSNDYPFVTVDYLHYLWDKYHGQQVVVATSDFISSNEKRGYMHIIDKVDLYTGDSIHYNKAYDIFTVDDIIMETKMGQICFKMHNSKNTVYCSIGLLYDENPISYHASSKLFSLSDWNKLCSKHGKSTMEKIISGQIETGMSLDEMRLALGHEIGHRNYDTYTEYRWMVNGKAVSMQFKHKSEIASSSTTESAGQHITRISNETSSDVKKAASEAKQTIIGGIKEAFASFL